MENGLMAVIEEEWKQMSFEIVDRLVSSMTD